MPQAAGQPSPQILEYQPRLHRRKQHSTNQRVLHSIVTTIPQDTNTHIIDISQEADVVIFGTHAHWSHAINPGAEVWTRLGDIRSVTMLQGNNPSEIRGDEDTVLVPLMDQHIAICPRIGRCLFPSREAAGIFSNKLKFEHYVDHAGLSLHAPATFSADNPEFPCVLKRVDLNSGRGVAVIRNRAALSSALRQEPWIGHSHVLQEFVETESDFVTHAVCRRGQIMWHCTYRYELGLEDPIQRPDNKGSISRVALSDENVGVLTRFLEPLAYDGPVTFDYRFSRDGVLKVIEINPRLGGSLMWVSNLFGALSTIIKFAYAAEDTVADMRLVA